MPAYIVVNFTPKDTDKLQQYGAAVPSTLLPFNGEILARGPAETLHGEHAYTTQVIITFPSKDDATGWYHSPAYQALTDIRDQGMTSAFRLV